MSKPIPPVQKYMTTTPYTVGAEQTLELAHDVMREHRVRHLPVLRAGQLVGMLTERDMALVEALKDVDPARVTVEEAMSQDVFTVAPSAPLDEVASEMAARKLGSALVVERGKLVGIVTTVDVCHALASLLHGRLA